MHTVGVMVTCMFVGFVVGLALIGGHLWYGGDPMSESTQEWVVYSFVFIGFLFGPGIAYDTSKQN